MELKCKHNRKTSIIKLTDHDQLQVKIV